MFDLIKNKYEPRELDETVPITVQTEEGNAPNFFAIVLLLILFAIPISLITYGAIHLKDCPAERMVAISLIVIGGLALLSRILSSPYEIREAFGSNVIQKRLCFMCINLILQIVLLCWFFAMCHWIFKMQPDTKPEDHGSSNYCQLDFYRNIYWGSIVGLVLFGVMITGSCALCCYLASKI